MGDSLGYAAAMFLVLIIIGVLFAAFITRKKIFVGCTTILSILWFYDSINKSVAGDGSNRASICMCVLSLLPLIVSLIKPPQKTVKSKKTSEEIQQIKGEVKKNIKTASIFLAVGIMLCVIALVINTNYNANVKENLVMVQGTVVYINDYYDSNTMTTDYTYRVEYEYEGKTYRTSVSGTSRGRIGDSCSLKIDPKNPGGGNYDLTGTGALWLGLFAVVIGIIQLVTAVKKGAEGNLVQFDKKTFIKIWNKLRSRSEND